MKLNEIPRNAEVVLTVKDSNTTLDFKTRVQDAIGENKIWVDIIKDKNDKTVNFKGIPVSMSYAVGDNKPIVWESVFIKLLKVNGTLRQAIITSADGEGQNRRRAYRQTINLPGKVDYGTNQEDVIIRDVGSTGFSFISSNKGESHGTSIVVACTFEDGEVMMKIEGRIVRVQEMKNGKICYGCRYIGRTDVINSYIRRKKREES